MPKLLAALLFAAVLRAQTPVPEAKDPLGRNTPEESVFHFLEACHARDYSKATYYLDLTAGKVTRLTTGQNLTLSFSASGRKDSFLETSQQEFVLLR